MSTPAEIETLRLDTYEVLERLFAEYGSWLEVSCILSELCRIKDEFKQVRGAGLPPHS